MKRKRIDINQDTITLELCKSAILEAAESKHDRISVKKVLESIDQYTVQLRSILINNTFTPTQYAHKDKFERGKLRHLTMPAFFPDQCVHHVLAALMFQNGYLNLIDPYTLSSIPGRGKEYGIARIKQKLYTNWKANRYCIKADIKKCYDSITSEVAFNAVQHFYKGNTFLELMHKILYNHPSLPLGIYLSSFVINLILRNLDYKIRDFSYTRHKKNGSYQRISVVNSYFRYMDDMIILGQNKRKLNPIRKMISKELRSIGLKLKYAVIFDITESPIDFLGYKFLVEPFGEKSKTNIHLHMCLRKRTMITISRRFCRVLGTHGYKQRKYSERDYKSILSLVGLLKRFNSRSFVEKYFDKSLLNLDAIKCLANDKIVKSAMILPPSDYVKFIQLHSRYIHSGQQDKLKNIMMSKLKITNPHLFDHTVKYFKDHVSIMPYRKVSKKYFTHPDDFKVTPLDKRHKHQYHGTLIRA